MVGGNGVERRQRQLWLAAGLPGRNGCDGGRSRARGRIPDRRIYFQARERGRIYGLVLAGQGTSTAAGLLLSGALGAITWRLGFWWLAAAGIGLAVAVARLLPEPDRGGGSPIPFGATQIVAAAETAVPVHDGETPAAAQTPDGPGRGDMVIDAVLDQRMRPHPGLVLREDPANALAVVGGAVRAFDPHQRGAVHCGDNGYFVFTRLATFALALMRERFGIGQALSTLLIAVIGIGALIGVLTAGRIADWLIARGHVSARMTVAGSAFLAACAFLLPALLADDLAIAVVFAFIAAIGLGGVSPPLNAGRLDIIHSRLWGRAEAVRTTLRSVFIALAPLVFGYVSTQLSPQAGLPADVLDHAHTAIRRRRADRVRRPPHLPSRRRNRRRVRACHTRAQITSASCAERALAARARAI